MSNEMMVSWMQEVLAGIVQGVTELLPISSTAHLLFIFQLLGLPPMGAGFTTVIQGGSALALLIYFRRDIFTWSMSVQPKIYFITLFPAVVLGGCFSTFIKSKLYSLETMSLSLILGGITMLIIPQKNSLFSLGAIKAKEGFIIGLLQAAALIPGVSRMGATLVGAQLLGCTRPVAIRFSLLIGIPLLLGATFHDMFKHPGLFLENGPSLLAGLLSAFLSTYLFLGTAIKLFERVGLAPFGIYRIVLGFFLLLY